MEAVSSCDRFAIDFDQRMSGVFNMTAQQVGGRDDFASLAQIQNRAVQNEIFDNRREARDGIALAIAAGGSPGLLPGRKFAVSANIGTYQGGSAFAAGMTALLTETTSYAVVANGSVGLGFNTNTIGGRGGVSLQW